MRQGAQSSGQNNLYNIKIKLRISNQNTTIFYSLIEIYIDIKMGRVVRRSIDSSRSSSAIRRSNAAEKNLRRNSSLSCGNLFQVNEVISPFAMSPGNSQVHTGVSKLEKKKKRFSFKRLFSKTIKSEVEVETHDCESIITSTPECHPTAVNSMRRLIRSITRANLQTDQCSKTPILRQRELIISSGIVIWEEDIDFTVDEDFSAIARICSARSHKG